MILRMFFLLLLYFKAKKVFCQQFRLFFRKQNEILVQIWNVESLYEQGRLLI